MCRVQRRAYRFPGAFDGSLLEARAFSAAPRIVRTRFPDCMRCNGGDTFIFVLGRAHASGSLLLRCARVEMRAHSQCVPSYVETRNTSTTVMI